MSELMRRRTFLTAVAAGTTVAATGVATAAQACAAVKKPTTVAYIEVNDHSMLSAGKYTLANDGRPVVDIAVIFAANINFNTTTRKAYLSFNPQVTNVLNNRATQIKPLQDKGIKVLLSILGNHQGAGFANFPDQASAAAFAQELANAVSTYGLDGIDFDDEYVEYGNNGTGQPNASSFVYLVQALRQKLPAGKLITLYDIGPASTKLQYNGVNLANVFDYAWQPYYGSYSANPAFAKSKYSPAAVSYTATSQATAASFAQRTVTDGYGVFLTYNLTEANTATYMSAFTQKLYGKNTVYTP
ncbi:endo-beta-N-acetylglucosaminidase H [Kribbella sp. NPDC051587]|uniref:endo-beta-N-acetylglucosaminidase H n=1 Tax=Kribbella sp. NPDC051587 TaxID=3364119 RepID=UPI00378ACFD3